MLSKEMSSLKDWWMNLSLREKRVVAFGGMALFFLLIYWLIWSPLMNANDNLRARLIENKDLLSWMQTADANLSGLEKNFRSHTQQQKNSLPTIIQTEIQKMHFGGKVTQLKLSEEGMQVSIENVSFDDFIKWLIGLWQNHGVEASRVTVTSTPAPGIVNIDCILE